MSASFQKDETEVLYDLGERDLDPIERMRIVVTVDGDHRTTDLPAEVQQPSAAPELLGFFPNALINIIADLKVLLADGYGIIRIGLGYQPPKAG